MTTFNNKLMKFKINL